MINTKKLIKMARKWQKKAAIKGRKRICSHGSPEKGHFVVYTTDRKRYSIPIAYLNDNMIFRELFRMAEEEFGLPCDGPITIPCDALIMNYLISLIKRGAGAAEDVEKLLLISVPDHSGFCSSSSYSTRSLLHQPLHVF